MKLAIRESHEYVLRGLAQIAACLSYMNWPIPVKKLREYYVSKNKIVRT